MLQTGGLVQGPTTGAISSDPVQYIDDGALAIAQVAQLQAQLAQKHPLIGQGDLPQDFVSGLVSDLGARALSSEVTAQLGTKADAAATNTALALKADAAATNTALAGKAGLTEFQEANAQRIQVDTRIEADLLDLTNGLAGKEPVIAEGSLAQSKVANLVTDLATKQNVIDASSDVIVDTISSRVYLPATAGQSVIFEDGLGNDLLTLGAANAYSAQGMVAPWFSTTGSIVAQDVDLLGAINSKQAIVTNDSLQISHVAGLQTALNDAGGAIADGELTIASTNGLQDALNGKADAASVTTQLSYKQNLIGTDSLAISTVSGLQNALDSKGPALSDLPGTGTSFLYDAVNGVVRKIYGEAGVSVDQTINLNDASDPNNYQIRISGSSLLAAIAQKADSSSLAGLLQRSGPDVFTGDLDITGHCTLGRVVLGSGSFEEHNGSFRVLNAVHDVGFNFAVSSVSPPAAEDVVLSLDSQTGATVQGALSVSGNASVGGSAYVTGGLQVGGLVIDGTEIHMFSAERAGGNSHPGRALVHLPGDQLVLNYDSDFSGGTLVNSACTVSGTLSAPSLACSLLKAAPGQSGLRITDSTGTVLLNLGAGANTFLNGISAPVLESTGDAMVGGTLTVAGTNVMDAIANAGGSAIDSSADLSVNTLTTASDVTVGGTLTGNIIQSTGGGYQNRAMFRNVSQNNAGADFFSGINGVPQFSIYNSTNSRLEFWSLVYSQIKCMQIETSGYVNFFFGTNAASDRVLKDEIRDMPDEEALTLLRAVSAKTYVRKDIGDNKRRAGFIAQDFEDVPESLGQNFVRKTAYSVEKGAADQEILTLDYDRTSVVLWQCCRSLLARVEALEARLS